MPPQSKTDKLIERQDRLREAMNLAEYYGNSDVARSIQDLHNTVQEQVNNSMQDENNAQEGW